MIRVVIVDDSLVCRTQLKSMLEQEGDIRVVGDANDGHTALAVIERTRPTLVTIDWKMPGMDGAELLSKLMATQPLPILVVTAQPTGVVFEALRRGALDLAEKPGNEKGARALRETVRALAKVPVVRHVRASPKREVIVPQSDRRRTCVAIGASAGGPNAVATILSQLPKDFALPVAIVQHLPMGFAPAYASFLRSKTSLPVTLVSAPIKRDRGVFLAADGFHLIAQSRSHFSVDSRGPYCGHRPSVSLLFESVAHCDVGDSVAVLLSGIGDDGVTGMLALRKAGGLTIAQDEDSCAVYGMPRAAMEASAASEQLSPDAIARLLTLLKGAS